MKLNIKIVTAANTLLLLSLLCFIITQLYITFSGYEERFENPVQYTKQTYGTDFITQYGNRFEEIKKIFTKPVRMTYIGEPNEAASIGCTHYFLTQYFLSPNLILRNNATRDTIIYNLYNSKKIDPVTNFHLNNGWHIVKDFNNGLIVLAK